MIWISHIFGLNSHDSPWKRLCPLFAGKDEAFSPQSQLSPVSMCSDSSGFSVNSTTAKKPPKKPSQTTRGEANSAAAYLLIQLSSVIYQDDAGSFSYMYFFFSFLLHPNHPMMIQISAQQTLPVKRPIQIGPKVSIQPKPLITAVPLTHAQAPLQAKTIIIQPLQTAVLPVVKPAPINIQPAPPTGQLSYYNTCRFKSNQSLFI